MGRHVRQFTIRSSSLASRRKPTACSRVTPPVEEPDCHHFAANVETGMAAAPFFDSSLLILAGSDAEPWHRPPPCGSSWVQDLPAAFDACMP